MIFIIILVLQFYVYRVFCRLPTMALLPAGLLYAQWVCRGPSRKSEIRWSHCGNCINRRHFPKRWEKVASEFKRRVLLRDLPQLPSGNRTSVIRWPPAPTTAAFEGALSLACREEDRKKTRWDKNKHKQEYNSIHGLCLRSHSLNWTHWRQWFPFSSACCVDCMVLLPKVSRYIKAQSVCVSFYLSLSF